MRNGIVCFAIFYIQECLFLLYEKFSDLNLNSFIIVP